MGICKKFMYLGTDGKKHPAYYQNVHLGHNRALSLYLEAMENVLQTQFSKNYTFSDLVLESKAGDFSGKSKRGGAHASLQVVKPYADDDLVEKIVVNSRMTYIRKHVEGINDDTWGIMDRAAQLSKNEEYRQVVIAYFDKNPNEFKREKEKKRKEWKADTEEKSDFHEILEKYTTARNKVENTEDIKGLAEKVIDDRYKNRTSTKTMYRRSISLSMLSQFEQFLTTELRGNANAQVAPEITVNINEWGKRGVVDLMIYFPDTNKLKIYDFKFYDEGTFDNYKTPYGRLMDPAGGLASSRKVANDLQTSLYRLMIEKKGMKVNSVSAEIVPFILSKEGIEEDGQFISDISQYTKVKLQKSISSIYQRDTIEQILKKEGVNIVPSVDTWRDNESADKISDVASLAEFIVTNSALKSNIVSLNKKETVDSINIVESENHNYYYYNTIVGSDVMLKGKTDVERKKELKVYLDKKVIHRDETVDLVLDYLYSGKKNWGDRKPKKVTKSDVQKGQDLLAQIIKATEDDSYEEGKQVNVAEAMDAIMGAKYYKTAGKEEVINTLFSGMDTADWEFSKITSDPRFTDVEMNIIVARRGNQIKLISLTDSFDPDMKFQHNNKNKYTNILGNFISDDQAKLLNISTSSSSFNVELLAMQFIMKEMQFMDPNLSFEPAKVGRLRGGRGQYPKTMPLATADNIVNRLLNIIKEDVTTKYTNVLSTPLVKADQRADQDSYVTVLLDALNNSYDYFLQAKISSNMTLAVTLATANIHDGKNIKKVAKELQALMKDMQVDASKNRNESDLHKNKVYNAAAALMILIRGIDPKLRETDEVISKLGLLKDATTMSNMGSAILSKMELIYSGAKTEVFQAYEHRLGSYKTLVGKLMKQKNITKTDIEHSASIRQSVFENIYENWDPDNAYDVKNKMMLFKKTSDPSLLSEERALIEFMMKTQKDMAIMSLGEKKVEELIKSGKYNPRSVYVTKQSDDTKADVEHWNIGKRILNSIKKLKDRAMPYNPQESTIGESFFNYGVHNPFGTQLVSDTARMETLGYNMDGQKIVSEEQFPPETNLDIIFEDVVLSSLVQARYEEALAVKAAVDNILIVNDMGGEAKSKLLRKVLDQFTDLILLGYSESSRNETKGEKAVKGGSSVISAVILSGSLSYLMTDSLVNAVNTVGETLTQGLLHAFSGDDPDFGFKDLSWAINFMLKQGDLAEALMFKYSMIVRDPEKLRDPRFRKTMAKLFTSKSMYWLNALPIEYAQGVVLIAKMKREGSIQAHTLNEFGVIEYDETKDKRFSAQPGEVISDREKKRREARHRLTAQYLSEEAAGVNETGKFLRAYTNIDIKNIQTMTTERFASLSADQQILWQTTALGIAFARFKNWFIAKAEVWNKARNEDSVSTHDVFYMEDENGEMQAIYKGRVTEGIMQTLGYLLGYLRQNGKDFSNLEMDIGRKKNMARMTVDLSMWFVLWLLAKGLFFEDEYQLKWDEETGRMTHKKIPKSDMENMMMRIYRNGTGDLTFVQPLYDIFFAHGSNLFPIMSVAQRVLASGMGLMVIPFDDDTWEDKFGTMWHQLNSVARVSGGVRTAEDFGSWGLTKVGVLEED